MVAGGEKRERWDGKKTQSSTDKSIYFLCRAGDYKEEAEDNCGDFLVNTTLSRGIKPLGIAGNRKVIGGQTQLQPFQSIQLRPFSLVPKNLMMPYRQTISQEPQSVLPTCLFQIFCVLWTPIKRGISPIVLKLTGLFSYCSSSSASSTRY